MAGSLRRCLGPVAVSAQAMGTVGLTLTAVFNIPEAMRSAGEATWISYGLALLLMLLVGETLVSVSYTHLTLPTNREV